MPSDDRVEQVAAEGARHDSSIPPGILSNPDKVFWPAKGYTKRDLVEYYVQVSPVLLPFLRGRPTLLVRYPDGIEGKSFFQWRPPQGAEEYVRSMERREDESKNKRAFLIESVEGLAYVANLGCIPLHVLAMRKDSPEVADFLSLDFDLNGQPFRGAVTLAATLREMLVEAGLRGFPKTSGQTGLHVLVPLGPRASFEVAKLLAELLGRLIVAHHPDLATMERVVAKRGPRIYVDTGQTGRSRAIVAPYSLRAAPEATVSTPLDWEEVHPALDPKTFTIRTVPQRILERPDPLAGLLDVHPDLPSALARLEPLLTRNSPARS